MALVGVYLAGAMLAHDWPAAHRYAGLLAASTVATLVNPYSYRLHAHIWQYLRSDFIRNRVEEFQSPRFRGESMLVFEVLLVVGLLAVPALWRRGERSSALLVVLLAHAALGSVRHVLLYVVVATPAVARQLSTRLESSENSWLQAFRSLAADYTPRPGKWHVPWCAPGAMVLAALLLDSGPARWRVDFPQEKFPRAALARAEEKIVGRRVFTSACASAA